MKMWLYLISNFIISFNDGINEYFMGNQKRKPEEGDYPVWYQTPKNLMLWQVKLIFTIVSKKDGLLPKAVK